MQTKFVIRNYAQVQKFLKELPRGVLRVALEAYSKYILGDERHGLKHDDPYKFVSRKRAYGKVSDAPAGYFSWEQFRYVAMITEGFTKFGRKNSPTQSSQSWGYKTTNNGYGVTLTNNAGSTPFIRGEATQARQPALVGWRKVSKVIADNAAGAMRSAHAAVNKWIAQNKPKG